MEWVETTGSDLDEAKERALDQLGVDVSDAEFEIVAEPKAGLFGFGRADARVRARVKPRQPRAKADNRRKRSQGGRSRKSNGRGEGRGRKHGQKRQQGKSSAKSGGQEKTSESEGSAKQKQAAGGGTSQNKGQSRDKSRQTGKGKETPVTERMDVEEQTEVASDFVQGLVDSFGIEGTAGVDVDGETLTVNVAGDGLGLLIGPQGATLRSLEELTRTVLQRRADGRKYHRIRVDVGGYKQRRREALESFTRDLADQVLADGVARALEPMPAPDRKVVHDTVIEIDGVDTVSEGEDPRRRVVLVPAAGD